MQGRNLNELKKETDWIGVVDFLFLVISTTFQTETRTLYNLPEIPKTCGLILWRSNIHRNYWSSPSLVVKESIQMKKFQARRQAKVTSHSQVSTFLTNTESWQCWHYCQLCTPIHLQFVAKLGHCDVSKCEIICQWVWQNCSSMLYTSLVQLFSNGTAKTKLAFLYCGEFVKNSIDHALHWQIVHVARWTRR